MTDVLLRYYDKTLTSAQRLEAVYEGYDANGFIPIEGSGKVAVAQLPPILRALMITDGTITKVIEAYYWEPVKVVPLCLQVTDAIQPLPWLAVPKGESVLTRQVELRGVDSGRLYARADSVVRLSTLPAEIQQALCAGSVGIGSLIRDSGMESFREILHMGADASPNWQGNGTADLAALQQVHRSYRIISRETPKILITEYFPIALYAAQT